jgi:hypothetical protein
MSHKKDQFERDFDAFLNDGDAQLSALYAKLPQAEPDAKLDAAVLAMAHRALNPHLVATPSPRRSSAARRRARWLPVFGAAATVVFAVGVAITMGPQLWTQRGTATPESVAHDQGVIHVRPVDTPAAAPEPPLSPPPPSSAVVPERQDLARSALKPAPAPAETLAKQEASAPPPPAPPPPPAREVAAPPAAAAEAPAATPAYQPQLEAQRLQQSTPAPAPQAAAPSAPARSNTEMDAVERKEAIAEGAWQRLHDNDATPTAKALRNETAPSKTTAPAAGYAAPSPAPADNAGSLATVAPKPAANAAAAPGAPAARATAPATGGAAAANAPAANPFPAQGDSNEHRSLEERRARVEAEKKKLQDEEARRAGGIGVGGTPTESAARDRAAAQTGAKIEIPAALAAQPQQWVAAMQTMLRDGRNDELRENLKQFRQRYPNYRLPADLDRFARQPR